MPKVKHHYVPKFHLSLFTSNGTAGSSLWVFDQKSGNQWDAIPESVGFQKHLYSIDLPDTEPDVIEDAFSIVETNVAPIIKDICQSQQIPHETVAYTWLINYIALLSVRTPVRLDHLTEPINEESKIISEMMLSTPERFEATKQNMRKDGIKFNENVSYESLKDFVFEEKYTLSINNNTRISTLMNAVDAIIPLLGARNWTVAYSPPEIGDFICSDNPVSLHWITQKNRGFWSSPGYGLLETQVSVPLSSRIMLLGRFEELPPNFVISSKRNLAILNSYTGMYSDRFIFSRESDFLWYKQDDTIGNILDFKQLIIAKGTPCDE
jgi:hypothetical protein